jgi:hypothetical protein
MTKEEYNAWLAEIQLCTTHEALVVVEERLSHLRDRGVPDWKVSHLKGELKYRKVEIFFLCKSVEEALYDALWGKT